MRGIGRLCMEFPEGLGRAMRLEQKRGPITALHIFDFDGTLVRTPDKECGRAAYEAATGQPWRSGGWWGRPESLSVEVLPSPLDPARIIGSVFDELEDIMLRSQTAAAVVVTGRVGSLRPSVLRVLDEAACAHTSEKSSFIMHDAVFTHPGLGLSTIEFKTALIEKLVSDGPESIRSVKHVHIWEDRAEHAEIFAGKFANVLHEKTGVETTVHFVARDTP